MIKSFYKYDTAISIFARQQYLFRAFKITSKNFLLMNRDNNQQFKMTQKLQKF